MKNESQAYLSEGHRTATKQDILESVSEAVKFAFESVASAVIDYQSISLRQRELEKRRRLLVDAMLTDIQVLRQGARQNNWDDSTPIPPEFFAVRSKFDANLLVPNQTIIEVSHVVAIKLLEYFRHYPDRLYSVSPNEFEEIIAELFDSFGFNVELTKRTRDGGRDIVAIGNEIVRVKYLIECKRYAKSHKVGVFPVRALHGVVQDERATKGILVTTSYFTKDAKAYLDRNQWVLEGHDFDGLLEWLNKYQELQIAKSALIPEKYKFR